MSARVAVIIAAYNAEATLERAIVSALAQPETAEVCVVDDGSRDGTLALARAWAARDKRVIALTQANAGPAIARNAAIAATTAPWIAILDADDYLLGGRMARLLAHENDADFIADTLTRIREGATPSAPDAALDPLAITFEDFMLGSLALKTRKLELGFLKPLMRRAFLEQHAIRYQDLRLGEDYELYARALLLGARFLLGGAAGYVSVEREGSLSKAHSEVELRRMRDCDIGLANVRPLSPREARALRRHWTSVDCRLQWLLLINAVKKRDARAALATFRSPPVAAYLAARLGEQMWLRGPVRAWVAIATLLGVEAPPTAA